MKKIVMIVLFLLLISGVGFCSAIFPTVGKTFIVTLESNPTTGYQWQLNKSFDKKYVELIKSEFKRSKTDLVGAPGTEIWTFKALKSGTIKLSFKYARSWEKDVAPIKISDYKVVIRSKR